MAKIVELPDGNEAEFPDEMSNDAIASVLQKQFAVKGVPGNGTGQPVAAIPQQPYQPYGADSDPYADVGRFGENPGEGKGGAEFHQGIASTPARLAKSLMQMTGQGHRVPDAVSKSAQVADTGFGTAGRIVGDVAATAFPASQVARATQGMRLLPRAGAVAAENAVYGAALSPDEQLKNAALSGAVSTIAGPVGGSVLRSAGRGVANVLGATTGAGGESVKQAWKNAPGFVENMRGNADSDAVVTSALDGLNNMRQQMYSKYATAKGGWASDTAPLDFTPVAQAFNDAVGKFGFKGKMQPGAEEVMPRVKGLLDEWQQRAAQDPAFLTVEGMDALKRHLQDLTPDFNNRTGRAFVTEVVDKVKSGIVAQRPEYAKAMKDYWESSGQLDEIARSLSLTDKASTDTALRKLQSLMRNNVNTNYGQRLVSAEALEQSGANILPQVAGQAMNSWTPRGMQGAVATGSSMANPASAVVLPAFSPRFVGETVRGAGLVGNNPKAQALMDALRRALPAGTRATTVDTPSGGE
jgi:hypothetical protein